MMPAVPNLLLRRIRVARERFLPFLRPAEDNEARLRRHVREGGLCGLYDADYDVMIVGTGDTPSMRRFYEGRCGFHPCFRRADFFMDGYPQPLIEDGVTLRDMIVFCRFLRPRGMPGA